MSKIVLTHKKIIIWIFSLVLLIGIFLYSLPLIAKQYLSQYLKQQGFDIVIIEDIDINLFRSSFSLTNIQLFNLGHEKLNVGYIGVNFSWRSLFAGGFESELITIADTRFSISQDKNQQFEIVIPLPYEGQTSAKQRATKTIDIPPIEINILRLSNVFINVDTEALKGVLDIKSFELTHASNFRNNSMGLSITGSYNEALIDIDTKVTPLADIPSIEGELNITNLAVTDLDYFLEFNVDNPDVKINLDANAVGRIRQKNMELNISGNYLSEYVDIGYGPLNLLAKDLTGKISLGLLFAEQSMTTDNFAMELTLDANLKDAILSDPSRDYNLLMVGNLNVEKLSLTKQYEFNIENTVFDDVTLISSDNRKQPFATFSQLAIENIDYQPSTNQLLFANNSLSDAKVQLFLDPHNQSDDYITFMSTINEIVDFSIQEFVQSQASNETLVSVLHENKQDDISDRNRVSTTASVKQEQGRDKQQSQPDFSFAMNYLGLATPGNLTIRKKIRKKIISRECYIEQLHLEHIEYDEPLKSTDFLFKGQLGTDENVKLSGQIKLFSKVLDLKAQGNLDGVSLVRLSPFVEEFIGYKFTHGKLDHKFDLSIADKQISMHNDMRFTRVELQELKKPPKESITLVPLPIAIHMLEDRDKKLELEIPVNGDLDNAKIGLSSLVRTSIRQAIQKGSLGFLKYSLQPYGAILFAAEKLIDEAQRINFEPMEFDLNSAELNSKQQQYAEKLAKLLKDKSDISINFCGFSNSQDKQSIRSSGSIETQQLEQQLLSLAGARAQTLKAYFIEQKIDAKRLFLCKSKYKKDGISGIIITM